MSNGAPPRTLPPGTTGDEATIDVDLRRRLTSIYEEIMWLARRPDVTPGCARAWYTHIMAETVKRRLRRFTGFVSRKAVEGESEVLRLEHFKRIQTTLSGLVSRHKTLEQPDPDDFVSVVLEHEQVHIVTFAENYAAMRAGGDYVVAGIELVKWEALPLARQAVLWKQMLRGKVSNAADFASPALPPRGSL
jgi:hypothetical protein